MASRRKRRSQRIEESGVRIRLFKRRDHFWADIRLADTRTRESLDTTDHDTAVVRARTVAKEIATRQLLGVRPDTVTLQEILSVYASNKGATLVGQWKRGAESRAKLFVGAWGGSTSVATISQTSVDAYCALRRSGKLALLRTPKSDHDEPRLTNGRKVRAIRDGALDADFRWLSSVFNWGTKHKLSDGMRLLTRNPLHDCSWPREKNVRRPIASPERYEKTLPQADLVDPTGSLRCILAIARWAGHRESAIVSLRAADLLLTDTQVRAALATAGMNEGVVSHMPHGAIRWSAETDKIGILHITPISEALRKELDRYLRKSPRLGDAPLFPSPDAAHKSMRRDVASRWLLRAESAAELPKLVGGVWHPYRRLWATERKHFADVDVAAAGGWKNVKALKLSYQQSDSAAVLAVIQNSNRAVS